MSAVVDRRTLLWVFAINAGFFVAESIAGWLASSMGLVADGLDMLADAFVYGLSLAAIGKAAAQTERGASAATCNWPWRCSASPKWCAARCTPTDAPAPITMAVVSLFALAGNLACLFLLRKDGEAHMQASWIFTSNDAKVNVGVMLAAGLVALTGTRWPDLAIGMLVFTLVVRGALRILRL
ncbi:MAG: cation transporter [Flavobacteriales bacterium]|nr:cation transporter [Flavobacteriales bacterium]